MRRLPRPPSRLAAVLALAAATACFSSDRLVAPNVVAPDAVAPGSRSSAVPHGEAAPAWPAPTSTACADACARALARARVRLERAADGLTYMSESDYTFEFVSAPPAAGRAPHRGGGVRGDVDEGALRAAFGVAAGEPVAVVSLDDFFARHIERVDPADRTALALVPRYRALKRTVRAVTGATRVYRVGTVQVRCYLVGTDAWGNVVGLATTAIET